jgi:serine/threonine protein kinase
VVVERFGPYRLDEVIERGGMGVVYRAIDTRQDREIALRLLPESLAADEQVRARFEREARVAAYLEDPHVVRIYDFGEIDGRLFLDMRLIRGPSLDALLRIEGPLDQARAVLLVEQVAVALNVAHEAGILHQDVKPSNVMVLPARSDRAEFVYVTDFGIAGAVEAATRSGLTSTGATVGTLAYTAPEQFVGGPVDR